MESVTEWIGTPHALNNGGYGFGSGDGNGYYSGNHRKIFGYTPAGYGSGTRYGSGDMDSTGSDLDDAPGRVYENLTGYGSGDNIVGMGFEDCSGFGDCYGHGGGVNYGLDILQINGIKIYQIDNLPTAIDRIKGNVAKGRLLNADLSFCPCYVVKQENTFAHGENLHKAMSALADKLFLGMPEKDRIAAFWQNFTPGVQYPAREFYHWHYKLTGSCEMGRQAFAQNAGIDLESTMFTPEQFIELTKNSYFGYVIKRLKKAMPPK